MTLEEYRAELHPSEAKGFEKGILIGIRKTIDALLSVGIDDLTIVRTVHDHWGCLQSEIEDIIIDEKIDAARFSIQSYMRPKGYSLAEIEEFMDKNAVNYKLWKHHELLELRDDPEKLYRAVQAKKK